MKPYYKHTMKLYYKHIVAIFEVQCWINHNHMKYFEIYH